VDTEGPHPTNVGFRWLDRNGVRVAAEEIRSGLARAVATSEEIVVPMTIRRAPEQAGRYQLVIDLVREGVTWFSERGVAPMQMPFTVK